MTRILFWLALVFLVMAAIRTKLRNASGSHQPPARQPQAPQRQADKPEAMLRCSHCGVHYPASENVLYKGQDFCSLAHAQQAAQ